MAFNRLGTDFPVPSTGGRNREQQEAIAQAVREAMENPGEWGWISLPSGRSPFASIQAASGARIRCIGSYPHLNWAAKTDPQQGPILMVMCPPDDEPVLANQLTFTCDAGDGWDALDDLLCGSTVGLRLRDRRHLTVTVSSVEAGVIHYRPADDPSASLTLKVDEIHRIHLSPREGPPS